MSTLRVNKLENTNTSNGGISIDTSGHVSIDGQQLPSAGQLSNRNLIINGAMQVAQRSTSETSVTTSGYKTVDRWNYNRDLTGTLSFSQDTDAPPGFSKSFKIDVDATATPGADDQERIEQKIENQNVQHLQYGTSGAQQVTVSFWVKTNKPGDWSVGMYMDSVGDNISQGYTVNSSGEWEYKTVTFAANTPNAITSNFRLWFTLAAGSNRTSGTSNTWSSNATHRAVGQSVNFLDDTTNYWQITGVQLEVGETATPFEHRSYGDELAKCLRYFFKPDCEGGAKQGMMGMSYAANTYYMPLELPVPMRSAPSVVADGGSLWRSRTNNTNSFSVTWTVHGTATTTNIILQTSGGSISAGTPFWFETHSTSGCRLELNAEL